ncbi:MAG: c-type cytochrome, partial [Alphaproteobacteria bacterium]
GAKHAQVANYAYSPAMAALKDKDWNYDEFYAFMKNPKAAIKGTKMSYAGLSKQEDRVNLIAYMRTLSDAPLAIPAPNPAAPPPAEGAAPADGTQPAEGAAAPAEGAAPAAGGTPAPAAPAGTAPAAPAKPAGAPK